MQVLGRLVPFVASLALLATWVGPARAQATASFDHAALALKALDGHIRSGYQRLAAAGLALGKGVTTYCAKSDASNRKAALAAFDAFVTAWGRIEHITFGPIATQNRIERILFFPDRRGLGARQIATALRNRDPGVTNIDALARKSVALQGIGAFEAVMLGSADPTESTEAREHRCRFGEAIAGNLAAITMDVSGEWDKADGFARLWLEPGAGNSTFLASTETTLALAKALSRGIEQVRDERLVGPLGFGPQRRKTPAVLQASGRTMRLVQANIDGISDLWTAGGIEAAILAAAAPDATSGLAVRAGLVTRGLETASKFASPHVGQRKPFDSGPATRAIISMGYPLKNAHYQATLLLTQVAGVTLGFNSSDGD